MSDSGNRLWLLARMSEHRTLTLKEFSEQYHIPKMVIWKELSLDRLSNLGRRLVKSGAIVLVCGYALSKIPKEDQYWFIADAKGIDILSFVRRIKEHLSATNDRPTVASNQHVSTGGNGQGATSQTDS